MKLKRYAAMIANDFEEGISLEAILEKYEFERTSDLGEWMCQQGYRWNVYKHRYEEDDRIRADEFQFERLSTHQRLNDRELIEALETNLSSMKKLLQGAFPIRLSGRVRSELLYFCDVHRYTVDEFVEEAIVEKMKKMESEGVRSR